MTIDPNTLNTLTSITLNVASNGLTSLLAFSGHKARELIIGKDFLEQQELDKTALSPILQQAIQDAAEHAPWDAPKGVEIASLFLLSPEAEELVRQIYAMGFGKQKVASNLTSIRSSFIALLMHYVEAYEPNLLPDKKQFEFAASALFDALVQSCNLLLGQAIDRGVLAAHEAMDQARYISMQSHLDAIHKELKLLSTSPNIDVKAILDFEKQYRKQVEYQCSRITPPNLQGARKHPIDSLYISPSVTMIDNLFVRKKQQQEISDINIFNSPKFDDTGESTFAAKSIQSEPLDRENIIDSILAHKGGIVLRGMTGVGKSAAALAYFIQSERFDRDVFFARVHRAVILGNPGAGKSTMAVKLCYDLAGNESQRLFARRQTLTPILVTLRVYGADKQKTGCSILNFIEGEAKKTYQLPDVPTQTFDYLLQTGRAMVIFDGLDELLDTSYRQIIRDDVELFCQLYPSVPVLVTSREVGYEQAPLDDNLFEVFRLAPFDDKQIDGYVHKWFTIANAEDISLTRRQDLAENFLKDSEIVPDLRSNPLMLALLCTIYHQEGYIPRYRPDVYEKCAVMLFERWDKSRNIYNPPLPEEHVRPLLEYLAHWIYANTQLRAGITETTLIKKAASYLHEEIYEDQRKAERVAREFIAFCTGRAWVFIDTGTQKDGESLYQFAHATFLEYFAASHLARGSRSPSALLKVLVPHIAKQEWDVMAQLAFQIYNKQNTNAIDELLMALVKRTKTQKGKAGLNLLSFAVRCLQFTIPRPNTRIAIVEACVELCIKYGVEKPENKALQESRKNSPPDEQPGYILDNFGNIIDENRTTVANALYDLLVKHINSENDDEAIIALEITLYIKGMHADFDAVLNKIFDCCTKKIAQLYPKSRLLSQSELSSSKLPISAFIRFHGIESLFNSSTFIIDNRKVMTSLSEEFFYSVEQGIISNKDKNMLEDIGNILLSQPLQWIIKEKPFFLRKFKSFPPPPFEDNIFEEIFTIKIDDLDAGALFGLFGILAILIEAFISIDNNRESFFVLDQPYISDSRYLLLFARFNHKLLNEIPKLLNQCHFTPQQQDFIWRWIRKEISLVAPDKTNQDDDHKQSQSTIITS